MPRNELVIDIYRHEHYKYVDYFIDKNGRNLPKLEDDLVLHPLYERYSSDWDIICLNENDGAIVIVEIKSELEKAKCEAFGQILGYMTDAETIERANGNKSKTVRGIILADRNNIDEKLTKLVKRYKGIIPICLKQYQWANDKQSKKLIIEDL